MQRTTVAIDSRLHTMLCASAKNHGMTVQQFVLHALSSAILHDDASSRWRDDVQKIGLTNENWLDAVRKHINEYIEAEIKNI
jgi:hypothetical protein